MKFKFLSVILILGLYGCDVDDPAPIITQPPVSLTENIEVYNPDLISNDYILAVENSSTTSYLLNKEGDKINPQEDNSTNIKSYSNIDVNKELSFF